MFGKEKEIKDNNKLGKMNDFVRAINHDKVGCN